MSVVQKGWKALAVRFLVARPGRTLLTGVGVALGAALLSAVLILGATMQGALLQKMGAEHGTWDLMVAASSIKTGHIAADALQAIHDMDGVAYTVKLVTKPSGSVATPVQYYVGLGRFPDHVSSGVRQIPNPGEVLLPVGLADQLHVAPGDMLSLPFPNGERTVKLAGLLNDTETAGMPSALFAYDWLAEALGQEGPPALLVGLKPGMRKEQAMAAIQAKYPDLNFDLRKSLDDVRWKLAGLGLVGRLVGAGSLLAGAILTLSAFGISVQERARELAMLRAIGASQRQVRSLLRFEACLLGGVGATCGVALGVAGAALIAGVISRYLGLPAGSLLISGPGLAAVWLGAALLTVAGAWPAGVQAGRTLPLAAMRPETVVAEVQARRKWGWWGSLLLVAATLAAGAAFHPALDVPAAMMIGLLGAILLLAAVCVSLPATVPWIGRSLAALLARVLPGQAELGLRNLERHGLRAARTAGILVVGTALLTALVGMMLTEASDKAINLHRMFPTEGWISGPWAPPTGYGDDLVRQLAAIPGVADVVPAGREIEADLVGYDPARAQPEYRSLKAANREPVGRLSVQTADFAALTRVADLGRVEGDLNAGIVVTRKLAGRLGIQRGEVLRIRLLNGAGELSAPVSALVDNLPQMYHLAASPAVFPGLYAPGTAYKSSLIKLRPDADRQAVAGAVRALLAARFAAFSYTDARDYEEQSRTQVQEQLAMVAGGAVILFLIAGAGLTNTMVAGIQERRRELSTLRAMGATPVQMAWLLASEASLIGLAGSLLGVAAGVLMLFMTLGTGVIKSGLVLRVPAAVLIIALLAGPLAAVLAALSPIRRVIRDPLAARLNAQ